MNRSTDIVTIILDRQLCIVLFTPGVHKEFNLIASDLGRPISDIAQRLHCEQLSEDAAHVLETLQTTEREVRMVKDLVHLMRITPYSISEDQAGGVVITFLDITPRISAAETLQQEQTIQESQAIFRFFVQDTSDVVFEMSHDWQEMRLLKGNDFLADLSTPTTGWMEAILPAEEWERVQTAIRQAIQTKTIFELEHQVIGREGRICWVLSRAIPLIDNEGRLLKWFGAASDITPQKKAMEDLRESEERLRVTMETAVDYAIIGMGAQGLIESWSRGAEEMFGWQEAEVLGKSGAIIFTQEDIEKGAVEAELSKAVAAGFAPDERWHVRKDGSRFFMSGVVRPIYDGSLRGFVKVAQDLTEQRHSAEVLRLSEERLRIALQSAEMAAWDWNIPADEIIWNEQHYYILGIPVANHPRSVNEFYSYVHPDDRERLQTDMVQALNQTGLMQSEFRIIRQDTQAVRWINGFGRVINKDSNGAATRMIGVMYDITERRKMEEQKEAFLGVASHELKTPLTSLKAYAEILEEILAEEGSEQSRPLIQKLDAQIDRLTELVRTLLDVTAMRAGKLELRLESFDLCELLRELAGDLVMGMQQQLRLVCVGPILVRADRERIGQVATNLLSNAMKYAPGTKEILLDVVAEQTRVVVSVQDFGIGISKPVQAQLFQRFYRGGNGASETFPGLGLGLYIAAEIVQQHGGKIWVESEPGQGSTFYFSLPVEPPRQQDTEAGQLGK